MWHVCHCPIYVFPIGSKASNNEPSMLGLCTFLRAQACKPFLLGVLCEKASGCCYSYRTLLSKTVYSAFDRIEYTLQ